jgi:hypothetical protein
VTIKSLMSRRELVRITLGEAAVLHGRGSDCECVVLEISAGGALLAHSGRLPAPPLTLQVVLAGTRIEIPALIQRAPRTGRIAVRFPPGAVPVLQRLIADEQRSAHAQGRRVIVERRSPVSAGRRRGQVL